MCEMQGSWRQPKEDGGLKGEDGQESREAQVDGVPVL